MNYLDLTLPTPAENLACDEALLDACEADGGEDVLRFWEPRDRFVVVGYANHVAREVNAAACEAAGVPVLRRCSGGGTVLQGPGCLNYSLILKIEEDGPLHTIPSANRFIMERNRAALAALLAYHDRRDGGRHHPESGTRNPEFSVQGHTDLAVDGRKFSGNAQRRKKHYLLFHGTFLLEFDLAWVGKLLPMPSKQPEYRGDRSHADFLVNLPVPASSVKRALREAWGARDPLAPPLETIASLARDKYATREWNLKF